MLLEHKREVVQPTNLLRACSVAVPFLRLNLNPWLQNQGYFLQNELQQVLCCLTSRSDNNAPTGKMRLLYSTDTTGTTQGTNAIHAGKYPDICHTATIMSSQQYYRHY
jgi:hypothetical protein